MERNRAYTTRNRALETEGQADKRRERNRAYTTRKRASQTEAQANQHRERNRACIARQRALETKALADGRRKCNKAYSARKRALESIEAEESTKLHKSAKLASISLDTSISDFLAKAKDGPNFVCVSCHRLMYK